MASRSLVAYGVLAGTVFLSIEVAGCASSARCTEVAPSSINSINLASPSGMPEAPAGSLFKEDQAVLSNQDFNQILATKLALPARAKLAVVRFGQMPYWWGWSEDFVRMNEKIDADFLGRLRSAGRVREVSYLPSLVTPREMTIPYLRQAAARFQADLLLIYRTSSETYDKQKILGKDQSKAYCTVEAILLDTRTGIIPFSTVLTESCQAEHIAADVSMSETVARAQQQAIGKAWLRLAEQVSHFLDALPVQNVAQAGPQE